MSEDIFEGNLSHGPQIDPMKYPRVVCDKCGHNIFKQETIMYKIPGVALGMGGGDIPYPLPVYVCSKCGAIIKDVRDEIEKAEKEAKENSSTKLII